MTNNETPAPTAATIENARTMYCVGVTESHPDVTRAEAEAEFDKFIARVEDTARLTGLADHLTKRWVCEVVRSGYHNGASCRSSEPHSGWGCGYYYEASIRADIIEAQ